MQSLVLDVPIIYETVDKVAVQKVANKNWKVLLLAFIAGCYVSIGAQSFISVTLESPTNPPTLVLAGLTFSTALVAIILCGAELFTGSCMMLMAVFEGHCRLLSVLREWCVVYIGNFIGCLFFAALIHGGGTNYYDGVLTPSGIRLCAVAEKKTHLEYHQMFFRGILANFCVCMAVLMALSSKSVAGKVYACALPIMCFVVEGFEHSIANLFLFSLATMSRCPPEHKKYWINLSIVTIGNILGAGILSVVYWKAYLHETVRAPESTAAATTRNAHVDPAVTAARTDHHEMEMNGGAHDLN